MRVVYVVFYSSFVGSKQSQIKKKLESIFEKYNVSKDSQESIKEMVKALSKKTFMPDQGGQWSWKVLESPENQLSPGKTVLELFFQSIIIF